MSDTLQILFEIVQRPKLLYNFAHMHSTKPIITAICCMVISLVSSTAQPPHYFTWYGSADNQSLKTVHKISQDKAGYIWIATWDGLLMFDGYEFKKYSLPSDRMTNRFINVTSDCNGDIWAPAYDHRLYRLDRKSGTFEEIGGDSTSEADYYRSPDGRRIYRLDTSGRLTRIDIAPDRSYHISEVSLPENAKANGVFFHENGKACILSDKGPIYDKAPVLSHPVRCAVETDGATIFGGTGGKLFIHTVSGTRQYSIPTAGSIAAICPVPGSSELLASTSESELFLYNLDNGKAARLHSDSFQGNGQISMLNDKNGAIWVQSSSGGVDWYDPSGRRLVPFYDGSRQQKWNSENRATAIFSDRQGILWIGTNWNGLMKAVFNDDHFYLKSPSIPGKSEITPDNSVRALMEDQDGNIWAGTKGGRIHIYDSRMLKLGELHADGTIRQKAGKDFGSIYSLSQSGDGTVWLGSKEEGLFSLSPSEDRHHYSIKHYPVDHDSYYGLNSREVFCVHPDSSGRVWLATFDDGLSYLDIATGEFISKKNRLHFPTDQRNRLRFVTHSKDGKLYTCGTLGVFICDDISKAPEDMVFTNHILTSDEESQSNVKDVQHITTAEDGSVYACTYGGGFYRFPDKAIGTKDGMMSDFTLSSVQDNSGNIWIATDEGLNRYNPTNGSIEGFSYERLGYKIRFNEGAPLRTSRGEILFNTSGGILHFDPDNISNRSYIPAINIRSDGSTGPVCCTAGKELDISFQAMDMTAPDRIIYYYRIDGGDWKNIGNSRSLRMRAPKIGRHLLELRSTNGNGIDVDNSIPIEIFVKAPFYASWWAISLYVAIILSATLRHFFLKLKKAQEEEPYYGRLKGTDRDFVKRMVTYISDHIDESGLDVQKVAEIMNVSRSRLFEKTKAILDLSPAAIIREIRFRKALELIRGGEHSLSEVAYMSGFSDTHYFSTAFKQRFGMTPGEYKKSCHK